TATATDAAGNTSEFSAGITLTNLAVMGTTGDDHIDISALGGQVQVTLNNEPAQTYTVPGTILVSGGDGIDTITVSATGASGLTVDGQNGSDIYTVNLGNLAGTVTVVDSGAETDHDTLLVNGTTAGDDLTISNFVQWRPAGSSGPYLETVNFSGIE